jgi:hypothetical protein
MDAVAGKWEAFEASRYFWDFITLACLAVAAIGAMLILIWLLGLPGRIAIARNHPDAEAVYALGWAGFAAVVPWIQALIWAFKPTDKVDIRNFPEAERAAELAELEELGRYAYGKKWQRKRKMPEGETRERAAREQAAREVAPRTVRIAPDAGGSFLSEGDFQADGDTGEGEPDPDAAAAGIERKD